MQNLSVALELESVAAGRLRLDVKGSLATLTLNRPDAYNSFTIQMYRDFASICGLVDAQPSIRVLLLVSSTERAFASGTDINEFRDFTEAEDALAYERVIDQTLTQLESCRVPTIAALSGVCAGGGFAIAACCDIRIAQQNLRLGLPMAKTLGNCLSIENVERFSGLMGAARLKELLFTARLISAAEARDWGLVSEVLPDWEQLLAHAESLASRIASLAPITLEVSKLELLRLRGGGKPEARDLVTRAYSSADFREGLTSFLGKRAPMWRGE